MIKPDQLSTTQGDAEALNVIRTETALSRFPVHRLSKKGNVQIEIRNQASALLWEVSYNSKFGQPGPLAYKVDTLIVNRRVEEAGKPAPKFLKLGSLSELCSELGISAGGRQKADIKKALHQNSSAYITAKISYQTVERVERWAEISDTRYGVVFTGEKLPDGREADAVYLVLHDFYRSILDEALTRPLDYDYMTALPPAAQRFYEIVSYQIYAALRFGNPRAKLLYSQYCLLSTATRYFDYDHVKKQMHKVHKPHLDSGYLGKVNFESVVGSDGQPDWEMFYIPGPNAAKEFHQFTGSRLGSRRRRREHAEPHPRLPFAEMVQSVAEITTPPKVALKPPPVAAASVSLVSASPPEFVLAPELTESLELLLSVGFDEIAARQICTDPFADPKQKPVASPQDRADRIRRQCAWLIRRKVKTLGMLRRAIEQDYDEPGAVAAVKSEGGKGTGTAETAREKARKSHEVAHRAAYHTYLVSLLRGGLETTDSEAYRAFRNGEDKARQVVAQGRFLGRQQSVDKALALFDSEERQLTRFREFLNERSRRQRVEGVLTFWEWDAQCNAHPFDKSE